MKFEHALTKCVLHLIGIDLRDLDEIFEDILYV
jgi:hypothetical protein